MSELQTVIKKVEVVLNDSPITLVYHDVNGLEPLTPSILL